MIHEKNLTANKAKLYVVTCISNPVRYKSRYSLYKDFEKMVVDAGAELYTVEIAFGNRQFEVTDYKTLNDIQLRTTTELWHKENALNIGIQNLPSDWEYVAWIDADICFARPDWVTETLHMLQHYDIVQMFSHAQDLSPTHEVIQNHKGFVYCYQNGLPGSNTYYPNWHPGFSWAARREALDKLGGLIDYAILGAADRHMAFGLIGKIDSSIPSELKNGAYAQELRLWEDRANRLIKKNIGYMPGTILHYWHGKKKDRGYQDRWKILVNNSYDPDLDLKRDTQGLYQLTDHNIKLRDDIRKYFRSRNEDSIDL